MIQWDTGMPATGIMIAIIKFLTSILLPAQIAALDYSPPLWNVVIYMSSEMPNLSDDTQKYQQILAASQKNSNLHLTVLFDPIQSEENVYFTTVHRGQIVRHQELPKPVNFGDGETLWNFLTDRLAPIDHPKQKVLYPATYYAFILSGDGGSDSSNNGWMPFSGTAEYRKIHINDHSAPISVGYDSGSNLDSLTVYELDTVLTEIASRLPHKRFDLIAFDACFMASFEVFYQLRNISKYMVASESLISSESFPYLMLEHFESSPKLTAEAIVSEAFDLKNFPLTQFLAIDLDEFSNISQPLKRMIEELSILIYSEKLKEADLLNWRKDSLLYADKKAAESVNVDFSRWLFSVRKKAERLHQAEVVKDIDLVLEIFKNELAGYDTSGTT
ncbi:MAG: clostripain-related cysteine peptidase, partial [Deltaproteobacteria bacterium]